LRLGEAGAAAVRTWSGYSALAWLTNVFLPKKIVVLARSVFFCFF
jgi:hypothetical protein